MPYQTVRDLTVFMRTRDENVRQNALPAIHVKAMAIMFSRASEKQAVAAA
jgi:hypothetical protein